MKSPDQMREEEEKRKSEFYELTAKSTIKNEKPADPKKPDPKQAPPSNPPNPSQQKPSNPVNPVTSPQNTGGNKPNNPSTNVQSLPQNK